MAANSAAQGGTVPLPDLTATADELARLLAVIEEEILPKTRAGVAAGNKVFGAAVLGPAPALATVVADTNHETECPLYHGEVYVIQRWSAATSPAARGNAAASAVFLSTHEPCCMCISAIVWAGFKRVFYLFPYEVTSAQGIPHDLNIMRELWAVPTYQKQSSLCSTAAIPALVRCSFQHVYVCSWPTLCTWLGSCSSPLLSAQHSQLHHPQPRFATQTCCDGNAAAMLLHGYIPCRQKITH